MTHDSKAFVVTALQWEDLRAVFGDAYAYRTNSGEGAEDEADIEAADRHERLAEILGVVIPM